MTTVEDLAATDPSTHVPSSLHGPGAVWPETNCALDMTLELVHLLGRTPEASACAAFSADFLGDSWVTLKLATEDLRAVHGLDIVEFSPYRPVLTHVQDQFAGGRLLTVEVDSWWLPDTAGTAYRSAHVKTSIIPLRVDPDGEHLVYVHNAGVHELAGQDFRGVFSADPEVTRVPLPYVEVVTIHTAPEDLRGRATVAARRHLSRRAEGDPVARLAGFVREAATTLVGDEPAYHLLAFTTTRQLGASAQLAAGFTRWYAGGPGEATAARFDAVAAAAHRAQLHLARAARGRALPSDFLAEAGGQWAAALDEVEALVS